MTLRLVHSDGLPANCQFCKERVQRTSMVQYQGKVYHLSCYMKLGNVARATGGQL